MKKIFIYATLFFLLVVPLVFAYIYDLTFAETSIVGIVIFVSFWILLELAIDVIAIYILIVTWVKKRNGLL